jgi:cell division protein FtsI (penicillin-binding protein 3)
VDSLLGGYSDDRYVSGFMGFVPDEAPKIVLLIVIDEPQGDNYGGVVAAPIFKSIMEKVLPSLNVLPKGTTIVKNELDSTPIKESRGIQPLIEEVTVGKGAEMAMMPDLTGLSMRNALSRMEGKGLIIKVSGNGKVVEQVPRPGTVIEKGDFCFLKFRSPS